MPVVQLVRSYQVQTLARRWGIANPNRDPTLGQREGTNGLLPSSSDQMGLSDGQSSTKHVRYMRQAHLFLVWGVLCSAGGYLHGSLLWLVPGVWQGAWMGQNPMLGGGHSRRWGVHCEGHLWGAQPSSWSASRRYPRGNHAGIGCSGWCLNRDVIEAGTGVYHDAAIMSWWCWPGSGPVELHHGIGPILCDPVSLACTCRGVTDTPNQPATSTNFKRKRECSVFCSCAVFLGW